MHGLIDLTMPIREGMPGWPDDPPVIVRPIASLEKGDPYELQEVRLGTHTGTHIDAPRHFLPDAPSVDRIELDRLIGPCRILEVPPPTTRIGAGELAAVAPGTRRLLIKSSNSARWADGAGFFDDFVALDVEGARRLVELGVDLVGVDALSVDLRRSDGYPVHQTLLRQGVVIVEGLRLDRAGVGEGELYCLPIRLEGADGAPCRAAFRPVERD